MLRSTTAVVGLFVVAAAAAQPAPKVAKTGMFKIRVEARIGMETGGQKQEIEADAVIEYRWQVDGKERTLVLDSLAARAVAGGNEMMNTKMSRAGMFGTQAGRKLDVATEDAPAQLKRVLTDSFSSPICKLEVDGTGKETKRTVVAGPGAVTMIETGTISNCTLFHPWYSADKDEWQADVEVSAGQGVAKGPLTFKKAPRDKGRQPVDVSGTLSADGAKVAGGAVIKDSKYAVSGQQTYDANLKEWVAGKLTMDVTFKINLDGRELGSAKGRMIVTFERVPEKK